MLFLFVVHGNEIDTAILFVQCFFLEDEGLLWTWEGGREGGRGGGEGGKGNKSSEIEDLQWIDTAEKA